MLNHRQSVRKYVRACEVLLQAPDLTVEEQEVVEKMIGRLSEKLRIRNGADGI